MGILQSVIRELDNTTDGEENGSPRNPLSRRPNYDISSPNSYNYYSNTGEKKEYARRNDILESTHQWQNGNYSTDSQRKEYARRNNILESTHQWQNGNYSTDSQQEYARRNYILESTHQWQNGNYSTDSQQKEHVTISVPKLRYASLLAQTSVNEKVKASAVFTKENPPQNACRLEKVGRGPSSGGKYCEEQKERKEGQVMINCKVAAPEGRWIKHYSSCHRILLVGEGDFSFSTCLAAAFGRASNMIATSLDSEAFLVNNYGNASSNIVELSMRKCKVMHEIDATEMATHPLLGDIKFDRIIFNFPFAGFFKSLPRESQLRLHRTLVSQFLENAKEMMSENCEIHISHKTNGFHKEWRLEVLAYSHGLRLIEAVDFNQLDYPGYNTKRGFGGDNNFDCHPSKTYKFGL